MFGMKEYAVKKLINYALENFIKDPIVEIENEYIEIRDFKSGDDYLDARKMEPQRFLVTKGYDRNGIYKKQSVEINHTAMKIMDLPRTKIKDVRKKK